MTNAITVDGTRIINDRYDNSDLAGAGLLVYFNGLKFLDEGVDFTVNIGGGFTLIGSFAGNTYSSLDKFIIIPNLSSIDNNINSGNSIYYHPPSSGLSRIEQIIVWAKISQSLASRDISICLSRGINHPNESLPEIIYDVRTSVEWKYSQNPNDASLYNISEYLYSLFGKYLAIAIKVTSSSVGAGSPTETTFQIQWDYIIMTANTIPSTTVLDALTLTNAAVASIGNVISLNISSATSSAYKLVVRYPLTESDKESWYNTVLNSGTIQDDVFLPIIASSTFKYIVSRVNGLGIDNSSPLIFS